MTENEWQYTNNTKETGKYNNSDISTTGFLNLNNDNKPAVIDNTNSKIKYFIHSPQQEADERTSAEFMDVFTGIWYFSCTFS